VEEDQIDQATQADRSCSTNVSNHTVGDDQEVERLKRELVIAEQRAAQAEQEGRAAKAQVQVYATQLVAFKAESDQLKLQLHAALEASDKRKAEVKELHRALTSRRCHRPPHQSSRVVLLDDCSIHRKSPHPFTRTAVGFLPLVTYSP
jgi:chromosome segregation ATPase